MLIYFEHSFKQYTFLILRFKSNEPSWGCSHASQSIWISGSKTCLCVPGLDSDESCEGTSEASFKDAVVYDGAQKNNGAVPRENGIKKHRYSQIPALWHILSLSLPLIFLSLSLLSQDSYCSSYLYSPVSFICNLHICIVLHISTPNVYEWETFFCPLRSSLPAPMFSRNDFSVWSILKKCIGLVRRNKSLAASLAWFQSYFCGKLSCIYLFFYSYALIIFSQKRPPPPSGNDTCSRLQQLSLTW